MIVAIDKIKVSEDRHRKLFTGIDELAKSIQEFGLIQAIVVDKDFNLIAGERRVRACKALGMETIRVEFREELDEWGKQAIEFEENLQREDLTWQEECTAKERIHNLYVERYGEPQAGSHESPWSIQKTAEMLGQGLGNVSEDITLARALRESPELANIGTKTQALKVMRVRKERGIRELFADILAEEAREKGEEDLQVILGDSREVLKEYKENTFDFAVLDPPYASGFDVSYKAKRSWKEAAFEDGMETLLVFAEVAKELYRVLKEGSHCYVFFGMGQYTEFRAILEEVGFGVRGAPLIWVKTQETGVHPIATDFLYDYNPWYEAIFYCWKGQRRGLNVPNVPDVLKYPPPAPREKMHPTEKPLSLIRYLVEQCSIEGEQGIDPYLGGGTFLEACRDCGRRGVGIECDKVFYFESMQRLSLKEEV